MKTLTIENGTIVNISEGETTAIPSQGIEYQSVSNNLIVDIGWTFDGQNWINPNPLLLLLPPPEPEWTQFNSILLTDPDLIATLNLLLEGLKIGLYANASAGDANALQGTLNMSFDYLETIKQPIDPLILKRWQELADLHHIPITFT